MYRLLTEASPRVRSYVGNRGGFTLYRPPPARAEAGGGERLREREREVLRERERERDRLSERERERVRERERLLEGERRVGLREPAGEGEGGT